MGHNFWTYEKVRQLRELVVSTHKLSAKQIGKLLGCSRNAVIGKCMREDLQLQNKPFGLSKRRVPKKPVKEKPSIELFHAQPDKKIFKAPMWTARNGHEKSLLALQNEECRFPIDMPDGRLLFCAAKTEEDGSYCVHHANICYGRLAKKKI